MPGVWEGAKNAADDGALVGGVVGFVIACAWRWRSLIPSPSIMGEILTVSGFVAMLGTIVWGIVGAITA
jgi:hypothetical protein